MVRSALHWSLTIAYALFLATAGFAQAPQAQPAAERLEKTPRHHEWLDVTTKSGHKIRSLLVYPEVDKPVTSVMVIHENRGLNDWAKSVTDQFAEAGYVAIAPDLLSGKGPQAGGTDSFQGGDAARTAIYALTDVEVREALDATAQAVRALQATTDTVVVVGFCWGGAKAFDYAAHNAELSAACVFYGLAPKPDVLQQIKAPVYGFYGGNDFRITGEVPAIREKLQELGKTFEPVVYEGAGHGFLRAGEEPGAKEADRKAREEAWQRLLKLLQQTAGQ